MPRLIRTRGLRIASPFEATGVPCCALRTALFADPRTSRSAKKVTNLNRSDLSDANAVAPPASAMRPRRSSSRRTSCPRPRSVPRSRRSGGGDERQEEGQESDAERHQGAETGGRDSCQGREEGEDIRRLRGVRRDEAG